MEIKIEQFFKTLRKAFFVMLFAFGAAYVAGYYLTRSVTVQPWTSYSEIIINTYESNDAAGIVSRETYLSNFFIQMMNTNKFYSMVSDEIKRIAEDDELNIDRSTGERYFVYDKETGTYPELAYLSASGLKGGTTIAAKNGTAIMRITFRDYSLSLSPSAVRKAVMTISETVDDFLGDTFNISSVRIIEDARPATRSSTVATNDALKYGIIAAVLVYAAFFLYDLFDVRVKRSDDLTKRYNIPVLSTVPYFSSSGGKASSKYSKYSRYSKYSKYYRYSRKYGYSSYSSSYKDRAYKDKAPKDKKEGGGGDNK